MEVRDQKSTPATNFLTKIRRQSFHLAARLAVRLGILRYPASLATLLVLETTAACALVISFRIRDVTLLESSDSLLPRKEVIQPHLPVQLPCYDFVPVTSPTFGSSFLAVRSPTSGVADSHDVTGGVYKARERIQRTMADARLLATPTS